MGGSQSRPGPVVDSNHGSEATSSEDEDGDCNCFLFSPVANGGKSRNNPLLTMSGGRKNDPMGSPLPDTPLMVRKRRQNVKEAMLQENQNQKASSNHQHYQGLEPELSGRSIPGSANGKAQQAPPSSSSGGSNNNQKKDPMVHEGPDCEKELNGSYELLEVLGVGSTSTVHRCIRKSTGEQFACKIIDCQLIEERFQGMMAQFQVEIEALRKLQHDAIIGMYDVYVKPDDKIWIIMELMEGGELFDYVVQKGTLTEGEASKIVRKVTSALVYMHSNNIAHRDLKPENLLLKSKPKPNQNAVDVKIIDFGLSKAMEEPIARTFLGTRGYLAPEMLQRRDYTRAVDMWALGVIVFVLLCGCLPFDDDSASVPSDDLVKARFVLRFPRWAKNLSPSAKNLLSHLLDVNPRSRYTAEQALDHPWVKGETAPKMNLLASPGRIKKSPAGIVGNNSGRVGQRKTAATNPNRTPRTPPDPPQGPFIRKKSL